MGLAEARGAQFNKSSGSAADSIVLCYCEYSEYPISKTEVTSYLEFQNIHQS